MILKKKKKLKNLKLEYKLNKYAFMDENEIIDFNKYAY